MPTNHDETLQERYAREAAAMEPKTPMVKVMAANWQEDSLPPTWEQIQAAVSEHDALERRVAELEAAPAAQPSVNTPCAPNGLIYKLPPIVLTGYQLRDALEFVAPDGIHEHMEQQVCIAMRDNVIDDDGVATLPPGPFVWLKEYPEEGMLPLDGNPISAAPSAQPSDDERHIAKGKSLEWQAQIFHKEMDKLNVPRDDGEDFYSLWGRVSRLLSAAPAAQPEQSELESALEALVNRCNNDAGLTNDEAVIAAEAVLEGLYRSRVKEIRRQSNG